jgi:hypothetical protein
MAYSTARYRSAIRAARRRARYGGRVRPWQIVAGVVVLGVMATGAVPKITRIITSPPAATTAAAPSQQAGAAIAFARARIGCPYHWGGLGPCSAGYDCSGLVYEAYQAAGVTIPRTTFVQWPNLHRVTDPHPGDLVFFAGSDGTTTNPGHVGLVIGRHRMIDAYSAGFPIVAESFGLPTSRQGLANPVGFARPVPLAHVTTVAAKGSYTPGSWARALLHGGGYPATSCNVAALTAWQAAEGDWKAGHAWWHNPLNDKRPEPGSGNATSQGVQKYTTWGQGFQATLATLGGPDYGGIRAALGARNNAAAVAGAVAVSPWGTQRFGATC